MGESEVKCGVCNEDSDGFNFGAFSCNACAAFFRRIVSRNQVPQVKCPGNCDLHNHILRRICTRCRYEKCIQIGMKISLVRSKIPKFQLEILDELKEAYQELTDFRLATFKNQGSKLTYFEEMDEVCAVDMNLILNTMLKKFTKLTLVADDQLRCLITNFVVPFILTDQCYRSKDTNFIILANGNYVNVYDLDNHYQSTSQGNDEQKVKEAKLLLGPYWKIGRDLLFQKFKELKIDLNEYLLICGLIFWDFGLPNQSDQCIEVCLQMRTKVLEELIKYENSIRPPKESPMRVGEIILMLQMVQKGKTMMEEYKTISIVYDLCAKHCPLFRMV
ncbi:CBN-NHR-238 protein [Caenorhabditis brenneri]|uniref:CBN-NHR-238 protein n=1 Tax=Caenorhabditis brenneri TaxID=135651 RepID=G0M9R1_CAEBE|nr:CBN-NHR-238 protein [Caenorhabditis brenneri]